MFDAQKGALAIVGLLMVFGLILVGTMAGY